MKKVTLLCLSLLSANALLADVKLMMDVCMGDHCMKGEFVLDEQNPVAELSDPAANIVVHVQQVEATAQDEEQTTTSTPEFEVTINNDGMMTTHMVHGHWGCEMHCNHEMVMVTMMAHQ